LTGSFALTLALSMVDDDSIRCSACPNTVCADRASYKEHVDTDWHKFNLNQRMMGNPLLSEDEFLSRAGGGFAVAEKKGEEQKPKQTEVVADIPAGMVNVCVAFQHSGEKWSYKFLVTTGSTVLDLKKSMIKPESPQEDLISFSLKRGMLRMTNFETIDRSETFDFQFVGPEEGQRLMDRDGQRKAREDEEAGEREQKRQEAAQAQQRLEAEVDERRRQERAAEEELERSKQAEAQKQVEVRQEAASRKDDENRRREEHQKTMQETSRKEEEKRREETRRREQERAGAEEARRRDEDRRKAEEAEATGKREAERQREEERRRAEEARREEESRRQQEAKQEEQRRREEEQRPAEVARSEEESRRQQGAKQEEQRSVAEERRKEEDGVREAAVPEGPVPGARIAGQDELQEVVVYTDRDLDLKLVVKVRRGASVGLLKELLASEAAVTGLGERQPEEFVLLDPFFGTELDEKDVVDPSWDDLDVMMRSA